MKLDRITFDRDILGGKACIRGMRISASLIVGLVANGMSREEIIEAYPYLENEDITQALKYAAWAASDAVDYASDPRDICGAGFRADRSGT